MAQMRVTAPEVARGLPKGERGGRRQCQGRGRGCVTHVCRAAIAEQRQRHANVRAEAARKEQKAAGAGKMQAAAPRQTCCRPLEFCKLLPTHYTILAPRPLDLSLFSFSYSAIRKLSTTVVFTCTSTHPSSSSVVPHNLLFLMKSQKYLYNVTWPLYQQLNGVSTNVWRVL